MTKLQGLRDKYGDKKLVCEECGEHEVDVLELIKYFEENEGEYIFTPEKIQDLAYTDCDNCGLALHKLQDKNNTSSSQNPEDANQAESPTEDQSESENEGVKPFSVN